MFRSFFQVNYQATSQCQCQAIGLFTSLEVERSSEIIKYEALNTKVKYENIDEFELGMYLRKNLTQEYINENGYDDILPKKVNDKTEERENREKDKDEDPYKYIEDIEELFDDDQIEYESSYDFDRNSNNGKFDIF